MEMSLDLQKSASILPRTSLSKFPATCKRICMHYMEEKRVIRRLRLRRLVAARVKRDHGREGVHLHGLADERRGHLHRPWRVGDRLPLRVGVRRHRRARTLEAGFRMIAEKALAPHQILAVVFVCFYSASICSFCRIFCCKMNSPKNGRARGPTAIFSFSKDMRLVQIQC